MLFALLIVFPTGETSPTSPCHSALQPGLPTLCPERSPEVERPVLYWRGSPQPRGPQRTRAQHGLFTLGRRQLPLPGMTSSDSRSQGGPLGTLPFLQGLGTGFRAHFEGWASTHNGSWAAWAWLPKVTVAFHQLQCKRSNSKTERWAQPTSARPQAGNHPRELQGRTCRGALN